MKTNKIMKKPKSLPRKFKNQIVDMNVPSVEYEVFLPRMFKSEKDDEIEIVFESIQDKRNVFENIENIEFKGSSNENNFFKNNDKAESNDRNQVQELKDVKILLKRVDEKKKEKNKIPKGEIDGYSMKLKLGNKKKPYKCNICDKKFMKDISLKYHKMDHTGNYPFKCETCGRGFVTDTRLEAHINTHSKNRPYKCNVCLKGFKVKNNLKLHYVKHTGEYPHVCNVCGKGFGSSTRLEAHYVSHSTVKPYVCDICDKSYKMINELKYHKLKHMGQQPHRCQKCNEEFSTRIDLEAHYLTSSHVKKNL